MNKAWLYDSVKHAYLLHKHQDFMVKGATTQVTLGQEIMQYFCWWNVPHITFWHVPQGSFSLHHIAFHLMVLGMLHTMHKHHLVEIKDNNTYKMLLD